MKLIFHIPIKLDCNDPSASQIRPRKLMEAFAALGWEMDVVEGTARERKRKVAAIKAKLRKGERYDFCYSESSTMPTLLTEPHHLPTHPFLDFGLLATCKRYGIPVGLFYRDIHWRFANSGGGLKNRVARLFYRYDLWQYGRLLDVLFLPTMAMLEQVPRRFDCKVAELPAGYTGGSLRPAKTIRSASRRALPCLRVLYVGGVGGNYNMLPLVKAIGGMESVELTFCCRDYDWELVKNEYEQFLADNINIKHISGEALEEEYQNNDLFAMTMDAEYIRFAAPFKLFEAIGHHIPILAAEGTWSGDYVERNHIGLTCKNEETAIRERLEELCGDYSAAGMPHLLQVFRDNLPSVAENNTWQARCHQIADSLKESTSFENNFNSQFSIFNFQLYKHAWIWLGPEYEEPELTSTESRTLLRRGGWLVRNVYDFDCGEETGFWYVIKDCFGGMEELSSKTRNQVRRSMTNFDFRRMSREELLKKGYEVHRAAAEGYKVKTEVPTEQQFRDGILNSPENDYWGAFAKSDGHLAAFAKNIVQKESCNYSVMKALPDDMPQYPYYGLIYSMNQYYLEECGLRYVNDGARSITEHSNMQPFLIRKFKFRKAFCRIRITYKPWMALAVKVLYPFRRFVQSAAVRGLLNQESMTRL